MKKLRYISLLLATAVLTVACSTSNPVSPEGKPTSEIAWPKYGSESAYTKGGIFPTTESLAQLQPGIHKRGIENLLGNPHYTEMFGTAEWTYAVHFHTPNVGINNISTCQLKVFFDKNKLAQSFYWNPIEPENTACPPKRESTKLSLNTDALFTFDGFTSQDILPSGKAKLNQFVTELKTYQPLHKLTVVAHTDRIGTFEYNQELSNKRAQTIRTYFINAGFPAEIIETRALGESQPIKECSNNLARTQLIDCLQPNRRVEVFIN